MDKEKLLEGTLEHCSKVSCHGCKYYGKRYCQVQIAYEFLEKAGVLKEQTPALPRKKTGIRKTADEICKGAEKIVFKDGVVGNGRGVELRVNVEEGREHLYKEIEEVIDYSQIPVGSIVKVKNDQGVHYRKFHHADKDALYLYMPDMNDNVYGYWPLNSFIKIIRWGK